MSIILTDIEGTTGSIAFVKNVLFPYARERIPAYLADNATKPEVATLIRDAYDLNDVYASWQASEDSPANGLGVLVGVYNVFDRAYTRTASGALEPGRNLKATIRYAIKM